MIDYFNNPFDSYRKSSILGSSMGPTRQLVNTPSSMMSDSSPMETGQQPSPFARTSPFSKPVGADPTFPTSIPGAMAEGGVDATPPDTQGGGRKGRYGAFTPDVPDAPSPALDKYKSYLDTMPNRADYNPGIMTRIAAAFGGMSAGIRDPAAGVSVAQGINNTKYKAALEDYANRGAGLKEAADIEGKDQDEAYKRGQAALTMGQKRDELERNWAKDQAAIDQKNKEIAIADKRANAYIDAQKRLGNHYSKTYTADGNITLTNDYDAGDVHVITPASPTVEAADSATKRGELGVGQTNAATNRINAGTQAGALDLNKQKFSWDKSVYGTTPPSPLDQQHATDLAIEQLSQDPLYSKYTIKDKNGNATVNPAMMSDPKYIIFQQRLKLATQGILSGISGNEDDQTPPPPGASLLMRSTTGGRR